MVQVGQNNCALPEAAANHVVGDSDVKRYTDHSLWRQYPRLMAFLSLHLFLAAYNQFPALKLEAITDQVTIAIMFASAGLKEKKCQRRVPSKTQYPFWFGGSASSMAACVTHPLDLGMPRILSLVYVANNHCQSKYA
jgi:hypothetical protein